MEETALLALENLTQVCSKVKISQGYESSLATQKHGVTGNLKKKSLVALASSLPGRVGQGDPLSSGVLEERETPSLSRCQS